MNDNYLNIFELIEQTMCYIWDKNKQPGYQSAALTPEQARGLFIWLSTDIQALFTLHCWLTTCCIICVSAH